MRVLIAIAIGLLVVIGGGYTIVHYGDTTDLSSLVSKDGLATAEKIVDLIRARQFATLSAANNSSGGQLDPALLSQMADLFPKGQAFTIRVTGWSKDWSKSFNGDPAKDVAVMQLLYQFQDGTAIQATFTIDEARSPPSIVHLNLTPVTSEEIRENAFHLQGVPGERQSILLIAILLNVFAIASFVLCLMGPRPSWYTRWLWALLTLVGVVRLDLVWTTGETSTSLLHFMIPPAALTPAPPGSPWVLALSVPLGAIIYWSVRSARGWGVPSRPEAMLAEDRAAGGA